MTHADVDSRVIFAIFRRFKAEHVIVPASAVDAAASSLGFLESQTQQSQASTSLRGGKRYVANRSPQANAQLRSRYFTPGQGAESEAWTVVKGRRTNNSASAIDPSKLVVGASSKGAGRRVTQTTTAAPDDSQPPAKRLRSVKMSMPESQYAQIDVHDDEL